MHTLDGNRFTTYSQHLRDMYNFNPATVEQFLKEMRTLATNGHNAAYGMRAKIGLKGLVNGVAVSPRTEGTPPTSSVNPERDNTCLDDDAERGPAVEERSRRAQSRQALPGTSSIINGIRNLWVAPLLRVCSSNRFTD